MVVATVVGSTLLAGADVITGSNEGLEAFVSSMAASAAAGATLAQVRASGVRRAWARQAYERAGDARARFETQSCPFCPTHPLLACLPTCLPASLRTCRLLTCSLSVPCLPVACLQLQPMVDAMLAFATDQLGSRVSEGC